MQYKYCSAYICCHEQRLALHDDYHLIMSCLAACYKATGMTELLHLWQWPHFYYTCVCMCVCVCVCVHACRCMYYSRVGLFSASTRIDAEIQGRDEFFLLLLVDSMLEVH